MDDGSDGKRKKKKRSGKARKTTRKQLCSDVPVNEVCLSDFANAPDTRGALKKISKKMASSPASNCQPKRFDQLGVLPDDITTNDDDSPWYDRLDDANTMDDLGIEEHSDDENVDQDSTLDNPHQSKEILSGVCSTPQLLHQSRKAYPFDIWCLVANFIKPEQIQTFSCICRAANEAVNSIRFWIRLYKMFVRDSVSLPERLKHDWIESRPGLRMRIVRALFISYKILQSYLLRETLEGTRNTHTVSQLVDLQCCQSWYKLTPSSTKTDSSYTFFYKFKPRNVKTLSQDLLSENYSKRDYLTWNYERHFIILQISVSNFIRLQSICGETLTNISLNLSRNMRYHCLKMVFHRFRNDGKYRKGDGTIIILDPVCEFRLLRWWDPTYPHCDE